MASLRHMNLLTSCGRASNSPSLTIKHHLQDRVVYEGEKVYLKCKINGHIHQEPVWYKNGIVLSCNQRVRFTTKNKWYKLEVNQVILDDHGVYTITLHDKNYAIFSSACIFVGPPKGRNVVLYTNHLHRENLNLVRSLINITIHTEQKVQMEAEFKTEAISIDHIIWYKNNQHITTNERIEIINTLTTSKLYIESAILTDSGIYTVVSKTISGVNSSTGIVQVVEIGLTDYNTNLPCISSHLPKSIEINDEEELRLFCKAKFDVNTVIQWFKDGGMIDNQRQFTELTGYGYAELKVWPVNYSHSGTYTVIFKNRISGTTVFSVCNVTVKPVEMSYPPSVLERKPLSSALASYGSQLTFDCCYEIIDPKYFYVVWYVGAIRVEHSNARFNVVAINGEYLLRIKKVEPCMAGEVVCQLWQFFPGQNRGLQIAETNCTLSIAPVEVLANEQSMTTARLHPTIHILNPSLEERRLPTCDNPLSELFIKPALTEDPHRPETTLLEINLRLGDDHFYYYLDVTMRAPSMISADVTITESPSLIGPLRHTRMYILEWTEPDVDFRPWYAVELDQNGRFVEAAITGRAAFHIQDLEEGKSLRIRIRTVLPLEAPKIFSQRGSQELPICQLKTRDNFLNTYKFCNLPKRFCSRLEIEGGIGKMEIVQNRSGDYFAIKHVSTENVKKQRNARREFDVISNLQHTKIVTFIEVRADNDFFIFVTELLWGGDILSLITDEDQIYETDIVTYIRQILQGLEYLHSQQIAHLDIKPANILCVRPNSQQLKIANFGCAQVLNGDNIPCAIFGSKHYVAPEMIGFDEITIACDMWSLGVLTYLLLSGVLPFPDDDWPKLSANITKVKYNFNEPAFNYVSESGKDFIRNLLVCRPNNRMTASEALNHRWLVKSPPDDPGRHLKKTKNNLKHYLATRSTWEDTVPCTSWRLNYQGTNNIMISAYLKTQSPQQHGAKLISHFYITKLLFLFLNFKRPLLILYIEKPKILLYNMTIIIVM